MTMNKTCFNIYHSIAIIVLSFIGAADLCADTWDGKIASNAANKFAENGITLQTPGQPNSATNPYTIDNAKEFAYFMSIVKNKWTGYTSGYYWKLTADIDLANIEWTYGSNSGNAFQGHFDGDNHTISNIKFNVTTNSNYGLFTTIQGASASSLAEVKNLKISGVTFTSAGTRANDTRWGALAGTAKQANISNVIISNVTFTFGNTITGNTRIGGAIGYMDATTSLDDVDVTGVTATFANTTTSLNFGGIVGLANGTANTCKMTNCDAKTVKVTHNSNITGATYMGGLVGNANTTLSVINNNTVSGVTGQNEGKGFDVSVAGNTVNFYAGGLLGYTIGDKHEVKNNSVEKVYITNIGTINSGRLGGFIGYVESNGTSGKILVKGNAADIVSIKAVGNTAGATYLGGFIGYVKGKASPNNRTLVEGNTITSPAVAMNGVVGHTYYQGGFIGYVDTNTDVFNNKVASPAISITNTINIAAYVGGAIGAQNGYTTIDGMVVDGGSITGPTSDKNVKNGVQFMVGGFIGMQNTSGAGAYQPNKFKNIAVKDLTINLAHYVPSTTISNHKFAVGGIAGTVNTPNQDNANGVRGMPENLIAKGVKIYAPFAATSPTVANFNNSNASYSNYTGENVTSNVDGIEKSKTGSWLYSDYKLGLSTSVLSGTNAYDAAAANGKVRRNYSASTTTDTKDSNLEWLTVNDNTFLRKNRYLDNERESWTVLWWTRTDNNANYANDDIEQTIYPQQNNADANKNPFKDSDWKYYMYFYQGVANAKYVDAAKADLIISGINANVTEAAKAEPLTLSIENEQEGQRGFAVRTITATPSAKVDSYKWYVDGVEQTETSNSIAVKPHWKLGKNIHVNAFKGGKIVASAAYALKVGVFKTKNNSGTDTEGMAMASRGTWNNPYIIDSEEALRQLSYLSTWGTGYFWEGLTKPASPNYQSQGHYDRAYYEMDADITMSDEPFVPISHMGYSAGSNGAGDGTYAANWIFQGNFDGKGHKISGLKITWGAGQYNGDKAHVYHGLFGAVGGGTASAKWGDGSTTSPTVIKNLKIAGATLTHDTNNTSFYYNNGTSGNANNCYVGVLAGIVSNNTTIQNIEISNSSITDAGSSTYTLAAKGLYVGGAIGSVQYAFATTTTAPTAIDIQHIAAQVDITLTKAEFTDPTAPAQIGLFNVGGIIGQYMATSASVEQMQAIMPKYTFYSGTVNAEKAWISPVIGALRYKDQNGASYANFSKQWEGNNATTDTQITITNALYYNFKIYFDGSYREISDSYPSNTCNSGFRTLNYHSDGKDDAFSYQAAKYQGVNYGAQNVVKNSTLELFNKERTEGYSFVWNKDATFVEMTTDTYVALTLVRDGDTNKFNAVMEGATPTSYKWEVSFDETNWHEITDVTDNKYTVPVSLKSKYVRVSTTIDSKTYTTLIEMVDADKELCNPQITKTVNGENTDFTFALNQKTTAPMAPLTATYQWYKTKTEAVDPVVEDSKLTLANTTLSDDYNGVVFCKVIVSEYGEQVAEYFLVNGATIVYINANGYSGNDDEGKPVGTGSDSNDGLTPQTPVLTLDKAYQLIKSENDGGTWDNNIIVIMGILNNDFIFQSNSDKPATLTGKYGVDYHGVIKLDQINPKDGEHVVNPIDDNGTKGSNCYVLGDTQFENLIFYGNKKGNCFIELHGCDAIFGKGLVMQNFANLSKNHGNMNDAETIPEFTILLMGTNLSEARIKEYTKRVNERGKPQIVTFKSGHYGRLMGGRFTQDFFYGYKDSGKNNTAYSILGSADYPIWAVVNVEIDADNEMTNDYDGRGATKYSRDVNAIITGLTDGSMYGDITVNFHGGNVAYIVGANQGNPVRNGDTSYTTLEGGSGTWGQWPNASFFGRSVINIDQKDGVKDITVGNLYAGGLGRTVQGDNATAAVDMYVYGNMEVNVKKGTVSGSVYGGGVGGVIGRNPWDAHVPYASSAADNKDAGIQNGVQYGDTRQGSWSSQDAGTATMVSVKLHNLRDDGSYEETYLDLSESSTTVNVIGGTVDGNIYGGGYGFVQDMPADATMQGVGSVFGTSNINISGGEISGNVYGGSQGSSFYYGGTNKYGQTINHIAEMNGTVNLNIIGTDALYPKIGGTIYGGGQGILSVQKKATQADVEAEKAESVGDQFYEEYPRIATAGNTDLGENYRTNINITIDMPESVEFTNDIYGGGALGKVDGTTNIFLKRGTFTGNIYGGGKGEEDHLDKAKVTGNVYIYTGDSAVAKIDRDKPVSLSNVIIYGGGNMAQVEGNTNININHGNIDADIYGGGKGLTNVESKGNNDYGKVTGNTRVLVNNQTEGNIITGNIYGGGALGEVDGNTTVEIKAGTVEGNIFGGGKGENGQPEKAKVTGQTTVTIGE